MEHTLGKDVLLHNPGKMSTWSKVVLSLYTLLEPC